MAPFWAVSLPLRRPLDAQRCGYLSRGGTEITHQKFAVFGFVEWETCSLRPSFLACRIRGPPLIPALKHRFWLCIVSYLVWNSNWEHVVLTCSIGRRRLLTCQSLVVWDSSHNNDWTLVETSANPDQILGSHGSRVCTMAASLHYKNIIFRLK